MHHRSNSNLFCSQPFKLNVRSYSPKPLSSKRKCSSCGKIKRISKCRKVASSNVCPCGKKEAEKSEHNGAEPVDPENTDAHRKAQEAPVNSDCNFTKSASYSNTEDLSDRKIGKISRCKVYDFNSLKNADKSNTESDISKLDKNSVNVIVPTTRKIFAPLKQDEHGGASAVVSFTIDESDRAKDETDTVSASSPNFVAPPWVYDLRSKSASPSAERKGTKAKAPVEHPADREKKKSMLEMHANVDKLPPASPLSAKRALNKDNNSSIKMMIAHYNKLMLENPEKRPPDSNCWASSLQKSPVLERRNRFEHIKNTAAADTNIRKSKSAVLAVKNPKLEARRDSRGNASSQFGISKSSSAGSIQYRPPSPPSQPQERPTDPVQTKVVAEGDGPANATEITTSSSVPAIQSPESSLAVDSFVPALERNTSFESVLSETKLRNLRLQEAKNRFFSEHPSTATIQPVVRQDDANTKSSPTVAYVEAKQDDSLSASTEGESNFSLLLNKSVSTGAIDERKSCNLPACEKSPSKSKFGFSSIASKFRKVKMRRHRDPEASAVSSLCRASLLVNLDKEGKQKEYLNSSKSCPSSPVVQRSISKRNSSSN